MAREKQTIDAQMSADGKKLKFSRVGKAVNIEVDTTPKKIDDLYLIKAYILSTDKYIQFLPTEDGNNNYSGIVNQPLEIEIGITNGIGDIDILNSTATVNVNILSGTATIQEANPIKFTNGIATIHVSSNVVGEVRLGLSGGNTSLIKTDIAVINFTAQ